MRAGSRRRTIVGLALAVCVCALPLSAEAQNFFANSFFSNLFGGFGMRPPPPPQIMLPFVNGAPAGEASRARAGS
jgi:hypothetical protein